MWKHKIIQDIQKTYSDGLSPYYRDLYVELIDTLRNAVCFYVSDYDQYGDMRSEVAQKIVSDDNYKLVVSPPPYAITLWEFNVTLAYDEFDTDIKNVDTSGVIQSPAAIPRVAILVCKTDDQIRVQTFCDFYYAGNYRWNIGSRGFIFDQEKNLCSYFETLSFKCGYKSFNNFNAQQLQKIQKIETGAIRKDFLTVVTCINVLNARNIVTKTVTPPAALNKKRIRNGKEPLYEYKILEVVKGVPKTKDVGSVPWDYKSPPQMAFHMCRGHFKTYTEDAPLFGKYAGTFWWQPHARGSIENGLIEKDYKVISRTI